jgi:4-amino-4-deoxy-L-arabinose transferase-like glycosyltransferase
MKLLKINIISDKKFLKIIIILAFLVRLIAYLAIGNIENPQIYEHGEIAQNLYNGYGFTMHWPYVPLSEEKKEIISKPPQFGGAYIPPLNPFIFYICYFVFGITTSANIAMTMLNIIFSCLGIIPIFYIAKELFNRETAIFSSIISCFYLPNIVGVTTYSGSSLYQTLALFFIYYLYLSLKNKSRRSSIYAGITGGLLVLIRSEFLLFSFIMIFIGYLIFIYKNREFRNIIIQNGIIISLLIMTICSPWIIRNSMLFGKFTTIVSHPWHEIWRGNNPISSGGAYNIFEEKMLVDANHFPDLVKKLDMLPNNQNIELAIDSTLKTEVLKYWQNEPERAAWTVLKRFAITWTIDPYTPRAMNIIYILFTATIPFLFLFGLRNFFSKFKNNENQILLNIIISFLVLYSLLFTFVNFETRYQIYLFNILLPFSGLLFSKIINKFQEKISN